MQVTGIGMRSYRANWLTTAAVLISAVLGMGGLGRISSSVALAQDQIELEKESDSDSAVADATDPVLVVTVASLNKLMQDVNYLSAVVGQPQAGGMFTMMAGSFAQGLDPARPIGVLVPIVDGAPEPIGVLPTDDVELMLKRMEAQTGPVDKLDDGTLVVAAGPSLVYIRQVGAWAVIARQKELLDLMPEDPMSLMKGLGDDYTFAARLNVQEIPSETREGLIAQIRQGFEQAMAQQANNSEGVLAASEDSIKQIEQLIRDAEQLMIGWNIDPEEKVVTIETEFIAADGTEMAELYSGQSVIPSIFSSVIDDENSMYYHAAASMSPKLVERSSESIESLKTMMETAIKENNDMNDDAKAQVTELGNGFIEILLNTVKEGKFDIGAFAVADDGKIEFSAGMSISDGEAAAGLVKDLAAKLQSVPNAPTFIFDEEVYAGVTLHSVKIDIPANADELRELFGEQAVIKLGTADKALYLAAGTDSEKSIKSFIDAKVSDDDPEDRPLGQMQIRLLPFLRFGQSIKDNEIVTAMIDTLSQEADADYLLVEAEMIDNGQSSYVEIGEGILKAIGAGVREAQVQQMKQLQQQGGGQF